MRAPDASTTRSRAVPGQIAHTLDTRLRRRAVREVDRLVRAELPGERQTVRRRADHDGARSASGLRLHQRAQPDRAGALDDDRVAGVGRVQLPQAAHRRVVADDGHQRTLRAHVVRHADDGGVRFEQQVLAEAAPQHRSRFGVDVRVAVVDGVRAAQPHQAVVAVAARRGVEQHPVPFAERFAEDVRADIPAERRHDADVLVPPNDGVRRVGVVPVVGVRPADCGHAHLHQHVVRSYVRHRELLQLQWTLGPHEHRRETTLRHVTHSSFQAVASLEAGRAGVKRARLSSRHY